MIHIPILRWGEPYKSSEIDRIVHFDSGEVVCEMSRAVAPIPLISERQARKIASSVLAIEPRPAGVGEGLSGLALTN